VQGGSSSNSSPSITNSRVDFHSPKKGKKIRRNKRAMECLYTPGTVVPKGGKKKTKPTKPPRKNLTQTQIPSFHHYNKKPHTPIDPAEP
jgi:hypothetical protein